MDWFLTVGGAFLLVLASGLRLQQCGREHTWGKNLVYFAVCLGVCLAWLEFSVPVSLLCSGIAVLVIYLLAERKRKKQEKRRKRARRTASRLQEKPCPEEIGEQTRDMETENCKNG